MTLLLTLLGLVILYLTNVTIVLMLLATGKLHGEWSEKWLESIVAGMTVLSLPAIRAFSIVYNFCKGPEDGP